MSRKGLGHLAHETFRLLASGTPGWVRQGSGEVDKHDACLADHQRVR